MPHDSVIVSGGGGGGGSCLLEPRRESARLICFTRILGLISGPPCRRSAETRLRALFTPARSAVRAASGPLRGHSWPRTRPPVSIFFRYACCCSAHPEIITGFRSLINLQIVHEQLLAGGFSWGCFVSPHFCVMICWLQRRVSADMPAINHLQYYLSRDRAPAGRCTPEPVRVRTCERTNTPTQLGIWR